MLPPRRPPATVAGPLEPPRRRAARPHGSALLPPRRDLLGGHVWPPVGGWPPTAPGRPERGASARRPGDGYQTRPPDSPPLAGPAAPPRPVPWRTCYVPRPAPG